MRLESTDKKQEILDIFFSKKNLSKLYYIFVLSCHFSQVTWVQYICGIYNLYYNPLYFAAGTTQMKRHKKLLPSLRIWSSLLHDSLRKLFEKQLNFRLIKGNTKRFLITISYLNSEVIYNDNGNGKTP